MSKSLYVIDGMALIYRAHFALIRSPIFTSKGVNTSALYGFMSTLLDLIESQHPDFLAIALDTPEPTERHAIFPAYKAQREDMPEDIGMAIPNIERLAAAMRIPVLKYPGHEADDIIGAIAHRYAGPDLDVVMVTPDKDFAQLVRPHVSIYKPGRAGSPPERLGPAEVMAAWEVPDPVRVADVLGLWGDASDNIPGIPGFGEKTAKKLISSYGSLEGIYAHLEEIKGKQKDKLVEFKEQAFLSRRLATINVDVPLRERPADLARSAYDDEALKALLVEFEFNSIGRRLYGPDFKAGHGHRVVEPPAQGELFASLAPAVTPSATPSGSASLRTIRDVPHRYKLVDDDDGTRQLAATLMTLPRFCFDIETDRLNNKLARIAGIAFSWEKGAGYYVRLPADREANASRLALLRPALEHPAAAKVGHNLKFDMGVLAWHGIEVAGALFDTMIAHTLLEPDRRHGMDALSEQYLGYTPIPITDLIGEKGAATVTMFDVEPTRVADYAAEDADVTWQLFNVFKPKIDEAGLARVLDTIEMPLIPVLLRMERRGIRIDLDALRTASRELGGIIQERETRIHALAGGPFNLNSPRQLGEILFERLGIEAGGKKTRTGQYATDESVLNELAGDHEIVRLILEYREAAKLKSTYVDALPEAVFAPTGRIHTTFSSTGAVTGRLASTNPNLQNIPIRSSMGQQIRAAFVAADERHRLLSADYSQIELRVMAALSGDANLLDAFHRRLDIHAATAARVYGVELENVTSDMRRKAKMVNFGIIYGISAFGLAQRLGIARGEAAAIIDQYFQQYPGVKAYMEETVAACRRQGYVETLTGRRRWIRDIQSANATIRSAAERTAINTPIQGTAADLIKIAMINIDRVLRENRLRTAMLLQVHDELVFDMPLDERENVVPLVTACMREALPMRAPIEVETGIGFNWLEAHG